MAMSSETRTLFEQEFEFTFGGSIREMGEEDLYSYFLEQFMAGAKLGWENPTLSHEARELAALEQQLLSPFAGGEDEVAKNMAKCTGLVFLYATVWSMDLARTRDLLGE